MSDQPNISIIPVRRRLLWLIPMGELYVKLREPMVVMVRGLSFTVPRGLVSDGASIPWLFWKLAGPPLGSYLRAAIVHDYLYRTGIVSKREADAILWELAAEDCTPCWQCAVMWAGLKVGGGPAWRKYERMRKSGVDPTLTGDLIIKKAG